MTDRMASNRKRELAQIRKRRKTLFKKVDEFHQLSNAGVYLLIWHNCRFYIYSSNQSSEWPPSPKHIATTYPLPIVFTPLDKQKQV
ncbi:uncharacterized protein P884DRAFT_257118, partial [Thermothelomyces heterothallicus CBS 202.75]|uniref:uncharacterized protein n=1 Tax=Thermothelomyces heterothallicus CBS 202.75 TaxID=1149848 RepID=UPI003742219D